MWHPGLLTTAGQYSLDHLLPEIKKDNEMAKLIATSLSKIEGIVVEPTETEINMVYWKVNVHNFDHKKFHEHLINNKIKTK